MDRSLPEKMPGSNIASSAGKTPQSAISASTPQERIDRDRVGGPRGFEIAQAFFAASRNGDMAALRSLLTDDIALYADGGGKRPAAPAPILGIDPAMAAFARIAKVFANTPPPRPHFCMINGLPGFVTAEFDGVLQTTAFDIRDGKIAAIYVMRNPDKLRHLDEDTLH